MSTGLRTEQSRQTIRFLRAVWRDLLPAIALGLVLWVFVIVQGEITENKRQADASRIAAEEGSRQALAACRRQAATYEVISVDPNLSEKTRRFFRATKPDCGP